MNSFYCRVLMVVLFCSSACVVAEQPVSLDALKVTSAPENWADRVSPDDVYGSVTEISADDFRHHAGTLSDVLKKHTLMTVRQSGGLGSASTFSVRGASSKQTLVLVDGLVVNNPMFGGVDLNQFTLGNIDRITLYSDVAPAIISQSGIGGVIALETARDNREETLITLGGGSFGTYKGALNSSFSTGKTHHTFQYLQQGADNDYTYPNDRRWWNPRDGDTSRKRNAEFNEWQASLKSHYHFSEETSADVMLEQQSQRRGIPSVQNWESNKSSLESDHRRLQFQIRSSAIDDGRLHVSQRFLISELMEHYDNRWGHVGIGNQYIDTNYLQYGWGQSWVRISDSGIYTFSSDVARHDFSQDNLLINAPGDERTREQVSLAFGYEKFFNSAVSLQAVARWIGYRDKSRLYGSFGSSVNHQADNDFWYGSLSGKYHFGEGYVANVALSKDIRLATLQEKYGQWGSYIGNSDLEREASIQVSGGLGNRCEGQEYYLGVFVRDLDPGFIALFDSRGVGRYVPTQGEQAGVEWKHEIVMGQGFSISHSVAWLHTENTSSVASYAYGKSLPGIYHWLFSISPRYQVGPFSVELTYRVDDELFYDAANLLMAEKRKALDTSITWSFNHSARLSLVVNNAANARFQDFNRHPSPGRSVFISLSMTL